MHRLCSLTVFVCVFTGCAQALASLDLFNEFLDKLNAKLETNESARNQIYTSIDLIRALHRCMQGLSKCSNNHDKF